MVDGAQGGRGVGGDLGEQRSGRVGRTGDHDRIGVEDRPIVERHPDLIDARCGASLDGFDPTALAQIDSGHEREEGVDQAGHAADGGGEDRRLGCGAGGQRSIPLGDARADEAGVPGAGGGVELGHDGRQAHGGGVARVDAAEQRVDQVVDHLVAQSTAEVGPDGGVVADHEGIEGIGRGREVLAGPLDPLGGDQSPLGEGVEVGGDAHHVAAGELMALAVEEEVGGALGGGDQLAIDLEVVAERHGPRHAQQERIGGLIHGPPGDEGGLQLAPESVRLDHRHVDPGLRHPVGGHESGDPATDHHDAPGSGGHRGGAREATRAAREDSTVASSFRTLVRAKAIPTSSARRFASMSRS